MDDYIDTLGDLGDEVETAIYAHLTKRFHLSAAEAAARAQRKAMLDRAHQGWRSA